MNERKDIGKEISKVGCGIASVGCLVMIVFPFFILILAVLAGGM